ncbi:MAG: hypothetical protein OWU84_13650 [Firmicutes bacterium]|nr:hypothetical protein [Bacillota bacterium]
MGYQDIYEKLWLGRQIFLASWDGAKYRLFSETPMDYLISEADRMTAAWLQYDYLLGRSDRFWEFVREVLQIEAGSDAAKTRALWAKWRTPLLERFVDTQIRNHKIVSVPEWYEGEGA